MSTVRTNAILDSAGGNTATINSIPLRPGILDPENRIINGAFDFWQRGTSFNSGSYQGYIADRWRLDRVGGFASAERQSEAIGTVLGPSNPQYFLRTGVASQTLASHVAFVEQLIEGVRSYAGQTVTVLGWARRAAGAGNIAAQFSQVFGTGGSPSAPVGSNGQQVALTGSWAPFALTFTVPSITGKTLGTNGNDYLVLRFYLSAGADYSGQSASLGLQTITVDLWGIHIKLGTHTVDAVNLYKQPELGPELARCQRYYEVTGYRMQVTPNILSTGYWATAKRSSPAITVNGTGTVAASSGASTKAFIATAYATPSAYDAIVTGDAEL